MVGKTDICKEPVKVSGGRPSKYDPSFCEKLVEYGNLGFSLTACAGKLKVCRDTLNEWSRVYPEFSDAIKMHGAARTAFLEEGLLTAESGPIVTSRIFALKNAAPQEWRDKQDVEHSGPNGGPIQTQSTVIDATSLTMEERQKMREILEAAAARKGKEGG